MQIIAAEFKRSNESFEFSIRARSGEIIYETPNFLFEPINISEIRNRENIENNRIGRNIQNIDRSLPIPLSNDVVLFVENLHSLSTDYDALTQMFPVTMILLGISVIAAFVFAKWMVRPIKKIASDTTKMSNLEYVAAPIVRADEIGQLANDVYKMYEHLKQTIDKLEHEIDYKEEMEENQKYFFSAASHELKTPVAGSIAILEAMIGNIIEANEYPSYLQQCLNMMNAQGKLISEILEIVRLNDGRISPKIEETDLSSLVQGVLPVYETLAEAKSQKITVFIPNDYICNIDKKMISRVFSNIMLNAVQNSPENGEIKIWGENAGNKTLKGVPTVRLCVLNTNACIDDGIISKLFEPFYRIDKARSRNQGRSGLGLTIVKRTLDILEIPFSLENKKGDVVFWMDLPID
jgi:two-component system sensor histidine kinase VanS